MGRRIAPSGQEQVRGPDTHEPGVLPSAVGVGGTRGAEGKEGEANQTRTLEAMKRKSRSFTCPGNPFIHYKFTQSMKSTELKSGKVFGDPSVYPQGRQDFSKITHGQLVGEPRPALGTTRANFFLNNYLFI